MSHGSGSYKAAGRRRSGRPLAEPPWLGLGAVPGGRAEGLSEEQWETRSALWDYYGSTTFVVGGTWTPVMLDDPSAVRPGLRLADDECRHGLLGGEDAEVYERLGCGCWPISGKNNDQV